METSDITRIPVALRERSYDILIGTRLIADAGRLLKDLLPSPRIILMTDEHVAERYLHRISNMLAGVRIQAEKIILPPGEGTKSMSGYTNVLEKVFAASPDRKTAIVALGGGVVGDLAGFVASTVLRGLPFIQIPTTLLAQVDSSVGGKTGINTAFGKNTLGSFYQPKTVLIDVSTLETLPKRQLLAGYAEIVKYGLLGDAAFFNWLESHGKSVVSGDSDKQIYAIAESCKAKAAIVGEDEREESGRRALLNLGHTFAHALEAETGYSNALLHGEAVAMGMVLAFALSAKMGLCPPEEVQRVRKHMQDVGLHSELTDIRPEWNISALMHHFTRDKKATQGSLTFVLAHGVGSAFIADAVSPEMVQETLQEVLG